VASETDEPRATEIAFLLFDGLTALDFVGPYDVLRSLPGASVRLCAGRTGRITANGGLVLEAEHALADVTRPDVIVVPGGPGVRRLLADQDCLAWLRRVHETTQWTTSVCTGALLLGAADLLRGRRATTHWMQIERLRDFGAQPVTERVVVDGKIITAAGVSAGIDMALTLAARIAGENVAKTIQLGLEYDPAPPFDCGSPQKAPPEIVERLRGAARQAQRPDSRSANN
jgi:transcriptional regulator GlxA family with amidase domain